MRTKTLLLAAALTAAGALTSMAQVYSVNIVGYINVSVPKGFSLVANQLDNGTGNKIIDLFPQASTTDGMVVFKFVNATGTYSQEQIAGGTWSAGGQLTMNPGEGVFVLCSAPFTATFVGQVMTGTTTRNIPTGFEIVSSIIPQAGTLYSDTAGPDLAYGVPPNSQLVYQFVNATGTYSQNQWTGSWSAEPGPVLAVGEAFFSLIPAASGPKAWTRTFNVGP